MPEFLRLQHDDLYSSIGRYSKYGWTKTSLNDEAKAFVATYGMTYAEFLFSANSDLIYFNLDSPMDIVETHNENVETLSPNELMGISKQYLSLSDSNAYGLPEESRIPLENAKGERILCNVTLSEAEYGMGRVPIANTDDHYYYIPVLILKGDVEYTGEDTIRKL